MSFQISPIAGIGEENAFRIAARTPATTLGDLAPEYRMLIDGPYTVVLATHDEHGRAQLTPMWFRAHRDGEHVEVNTVVGRAKYRHMRDNPQVTVQIMNNENPYHWVTIYGHVADLVHESDPERGHLATESIDDLAELYVQQRPYPFRVEGEERALFLVRPTQIVTFGRP